MSMRTVFAMVVALVVGFAVPASADDRPSDPFGNHTIELEDGSLIAIWKSVRDQLWYDELRINYCIEFTKEPCPSVSKLMKIVEEVRQNYGKVQLGHLNRSINLMIKPAPGNWTSALQTIRLGNGDCKAYSIAKYAAALDAGILPDFVRLVIVHSKLSNENHMITAIYEDKRWLILDNLTLLLLQDSETDYEPIAVLDEMGARGYLIAF
jgi:predicted transglutaminase-like cysteine proteinase